LHSADVVPKQREVRESMSYCRFSSDNYRSDLYCYKDCGGGWTTHVAKVRFVGEIPELPDFNTSSAKEYAEAMAAQTRAIDGCERVPIGLPHDGEIYNDETLEAFRDRVKSLLALGYRGVPGLVEWIEEEMND